VDDGGRYYLLLRPLDSLATQILAGTEGADAPFWSPDSRFLAFHAGSKLKKMEIGGGPPQTLCDAPGAAIGDWSRDGLILFADRQGRLFRVPAAGGSAAPVPMPEGEARRFPRFLPDSRHYLYESHRGRDGVDAVYVASLDSPQATPLVESAYAPFFAPAHSGSDTGHLMFRREGTLMAQRFDAARLKLSGEPFPVAEEVMQTGAGTSGGPFAVSENGVLAWRVGRQPQTQLLWFDRAGRHQKALAPGQFRDMVLSPDAKQVAVTEGDTTASDIWLLEVTPRGIRSRLTFHPAADAYAVWSPDGGRIAFGSRRERAVQLYWKAASGAGAEELLLKSDTVVVPTDWSRDGRYLVYTNLDPKTRNDLWVLPLLGDRKPQVFLQTEFDESHGQFSPDGRFLAYQSNETGRHEIYVRPFPVASGGRWQVSSGGGYQPRWRRDGKELFYVRPDQKIMAVGVNAGTAFQSSAPQELFDSQIAGNMLTQSYRYSVTPDGQRFLVNTLPDLEGSAVTVVVNWAAGRTR